MSKRCTSRSQRIRRLNGVSIALFLLVINLPMIGSVLPREPVETTDGVIEAPAMPRSVGEAIGYPGNLRRYYNRGFGFRESLITVSANLRYAVFGRSPSRDVLEGSDGWLFLASEGVIDDWMRTSPMSDAELDRWADAVAERQRVCEQRGVRYVLVIGPNKHTIYGEHLPTALRQAEVPSRLDQLAARLKERGLADCLVDPRAAMRREADAFRLHHKTDTHWNALGAYVAYRELNRRLWPAEARLALSDLSLTNQLGGAGDLARMMGLKPRFAEELWSIEFAESVKVTGDAIDDLRFPDGKHSDRRVTHASPAPHGSALVFHDSYGRAMIEYLARDYQTATFLVAPSFNAATIEQHRPDVVIEILVERRLFNLPIEQWTTVR